MAGSSPSPSRNRGGAISAPRAISQAVHNPLRREIAGLSPHDVRGTLVGHGGGLAARWDRRPEVVKQVMVEWLRYQLDDLLVRELALGAPTTGRPGLFSVGYLRARVNNFLGVHHCNTRNT